MVAKRYDWAGGAVLDDHTRRKHKILREYFFQYLRVRCQLPAQERFRLAIIDGFAGGGRYSCGSPGSPLAFIEELKRSSEAINLRRMAAGLGPIEVECLLVLNDADAATIELLKANVAPLHGELKDTTKGLHLRIEYLSEAFETAFPKIKGLLERGSYRNVIFNLDQCGYSHVERRTLLDIMRSYPSAEIFYTFAIEALLAFLQKSNPELLAAQLGHLGLANADLGKLEGAMNRNVWLGVAERIVFETFRTCAPYVSPFSINNPEGWRYWLIHFANSYRARQVYNNVLHGNSSMQAHFGRSGLNMLAFDPDQETAALYLFDEEARERAKMQLYDDVPRLIAESGDVIPVSDFYENIYNVTPAHADDVHSAIIKNPDIEVITPAGGERRKANTIAVGDLLKLRRQRSFFPVFFGGFKPD